MGLFSNILDKLGLKKPAATKPATTTKPVIPSTKMPAGKPVIPSTKMPATAAKPAAIPVVDVVSKLEKLAEKSGRKLDWKKSIVDLLTLLEIDSSLPARKELAKELGCPPEKIGGDYAEMNMWLHKTVLQKIAENGGNVPKELLD